ncbi:MAG: PD40 domain-containing protein [Gemmatimonadales bacterium]|nr:PD40 domain-containing protein [Gemmatimonadales bacterium]
MASLSVPPTIIPLMLAMAALSGCSPGNRPSASAPSLGLTQLAAAPAVKRVWFDRVGPDDAWRPSPDGRIMSAFPDLEGEVVWYDLAGKTKRVVLAADSTGYPDEASAISPDGRSFAYTWLTNVSRHSEIRVKHVAGPDSGKATTILSAAGTLPVTVVAWTPDGRDLIATMMKDSGSVAIVAIGVAGGGARTLKVLETGLPERFSVSPDSRWIAYDIPVSGSERDVYVIGRDGAGGVVARHAGDDLVMGWSANGARLLFSSERGGTPGVWSARLANGEETEEPTLVRADVWSMQPRGAAADGTLFYSVAVGESALYSLAVDPVTAQVKSNSVPVGDRGRPLEATGFAWSADGSQVTYLMPRTAGAGRLAPSDVIVRAVGSGNIRRLSPRLAMIAELAMLPDGRELIVTGVDERGQRGIFRVDLSGGAVSMLFAIPYRTQWPRNPSLSRDGTRYRFLTAGPDGLISELSLADRTVTVLRPPSKWCRTGDACLALGLAISPDESMAAYIIRDFAHEGHDRVIIAPLAAGAEREVYRTPASDRLSGGGVPWTADGRSLLFGIRHGSSPDALTEIVRLPVAGGVPQPIGLKRAGVRGLQMSPNGRTLMYGIDTIRRELWTMDPAVFPAP